MEFEWNLSRVMASSVVENGGGTLEGSATTYSEVLQGTVKLDSKPIFLKETDLYGKSKPTKEQWLTNTEMYKTLAKDVPVEAILGIQRVGSLWRLYIEGIVNRLMLVSKGLNIRGKTIPLYEKNPFVPDRSDQLRVRIKNIPLSADDSIIVKTLKDEGCILVENPSREKLRVDGKLTNCETGDRIVFVRPLKKPLPKVMKMGDFRATIVHAGQTVIMRKQTCGKCLQDNHRAMECMNDWVCKRCLVSGHKSGDCPMTSDMTQNEEITVQAEPVVEPEPVHEHEPIAEPDPTPGNTVLGETPMTPRSPREHRKADRKLKGDNSAPKMNPKTIQDYFKSSATPVKGSDKQKPVVRHSPPTPGEEHNTQKKTKIRGENSDNDTCDSDN